MTEANLDRIIRTRKYLYESALPEDAKDGLSVLLDALEKEDIQAVIEALILYEVRQAVRAPATRRAELEQHIKTCPIAGSGRPALVAIALKPWPYMLGCVLSMSPHAPLLLSMLDQWMKR